MAKDPFNLFRFRSKKQQEKDLQAYTAWAFPYGAAQRERVLALLERVLPRRRPQMALVIYLTAREAFWDREGLYAGIPGPDPAGSPHKEEPIS